MTTLSDLLTTRTVAQALSALLDRARTETLPVTAWVSGSVARTLLYAQAEGLADVRTAVNAVARAGFLDEASGDWLTLHALSRFDLDRIAALEAQGRVAVTLGAGVGPYSISPAGLVVTDGTRTFRSTNTATVTLAAGATTEIPVQAETAGTAGNVSNGTIARIVSPALAGASVDNPALGTTGTWITRAGVDAESHASLRERCRLRWSSLGAGGTKEAYAYWARSTPGREGEITRVQVISGPGDGTLSVYLAGPTTTATEGARADAEAYLATKRPDTDDPSVLAATVVSVAITGTVYVRAASDSAANRALATAAIAEYFAGLGIGDDVDLGRVYAALYAAAGVTDADLATPAADVSINNGEVAVPDWSGLSWSTV